MSLQMNVHNLINFKIVFHVWISIIICIFSVESILSANSQYKTCKPMNCGSVPNISYPFYIQDAGAEYCGYPGFGIGCEEGRPIYTTSHGHYIIQDISYENQSFSLVNKELIENTSCYTPLQNLSFDHSSLAYSPYNHASLYFFHNCTDSFSVNSNKTEITCASDTLFSTFVALVTGNEDLKWSSLTCDSLVVAPVTLEEGEINQTTEYVDYWKLLRDGFTLKWITYGYSCSDCQKSGGHCGFEEDNNVCFCSDGSHAKHCNDRTAENLGVKVAIVASVAGIAIIVVLCCCFRRIFPSIKSMVFWNKNSRKYADVEAFIRNYRFLTPNRYSYSSIKKITNSFQDKLGQGGYGNVYKGKLQDGKVVAVKVLNNPKSNGEEFINEIASISRTSHVNIVTLLGFCFEGSKRALVYEFMPNGSLEKFIYNNNSSISDRQLGWRSLYQISLGTARGLEYLHRGCKTRIVHFDIKPHNILLDGEFFPKISDFGLSKLCPRKDNSIISMTGARGTPGYIAPEVFCRNIGEVSHKSDVYSYGMMVLEMVGGRKNIDVGVDRISEIYFPHWIYKRLELHDELGLQAIANEEDKEFARKMIIVSLWCIQTDPSNRPPISEIVDMLEGSLESLQIPPKPFLSSPSRSPPDSSTTNGIS